MHEERARGISRGQIAIFMVWFYIAFVALVLLSDAFEGRMPALRLASFLHRKV